jgi:cell division protein FtsI/penicillin-binding protein 2
MKSGRRWATGNTFHFGIGQAIAVTPLQMAVATSIIANGGKLVHPHIVKYDENQVKDASLLPRKLNISEHALKVVKKAMWAVVNEHGTGRSCKLNSVEVCGKSGSADWKKGAPTHAWFTSFAPAENPQLMVVIIVEQGNFGGSTCGPIAKRIYKAFFNLPEDENAVG